MIAAAPQLLTVNETAAALRICKRTLVKLTAPKGPIPCVRIGRRVMYSPSAVQQWIEQRQAATPVGEA